MPVSLSAAWESYRRGDFDRAARVGEAALADDPQEADALHLLGLVALRRGNPHRAAALFGQAVAVRPDEAKYHASLAEACRALGQVDRAIDCYRAACQLSPTGPSITTTSGCRCCRVGTSTPRSATCAEPSR